MIDVLVADDHAIVRQGLKQILADTADFRVAGEAANSAEALHLVQNQHWDVVLLDISMPGRNGIETLKLIRELKPRLPVLILSMHPPDQYAVRLLKAGAAGYLNKESAPEQLVDAIRIVTQGKKYISPVVAELLAQELEQDTPSAPHTRLSDREFQIFLLLASGKPVSAIADLLHLSVKTISTYRARILEKMSMGNNAELTHYAIKNGLVE